MNRDAVVRIRDRISRGRARKEFVVKPEPYLGRPLKDLEVLEVQGYENARIELYHVVSDEARMGVVALACGGTVVLDDIAEIDGVGEAREPWSTGRFEGVIDFPDLHVAPASRRGFSHDEPVAAFLDSLSGLERSLAAHIVDESKRRAELHSKQVANQIRKAFLSVAETLPDYDFFDVQIMSPGPGQAGDPEGSPMDSAHGMGSDPLGNGLGDNPPTLRRENPHQEALPPPVAGNSPAHLSSQDKDATPKPNPPGNFSPTDAGGIPASAESEPSPKVAEHLYPPGPPERVILRPARLSLKPLTSRNLQACCVDEDNRPCLDSLRYAWTLEGPGELMAEGARARYVAADSYHGESTATITVAATLAGDDSSAAICASAKVSIQAPDHAARVQGIPVPHPVSDPGATWRSRVVAGRWEFNDAHRDFLAAAASESQRIRYLVHLFSKEIVLRNFGRPGDAEVLERMVEVLTRLGLSRRKPSPSGD